MKITTYIAGAIATLVVCFSLFSLGEWLAVSGSLTQHESAASLASSEECPRKDTGPAVREATPSAPLQRIRRSPLTPAVYIELVEPEVDPAKVKLVI